MALSTDPVRQDPVRQDNGQLIRSAPLFPVSRSRSALPGQTAWTESRCGRFFLRSLSSGFR
jgi:hypothetical protein